jgi:hypothetical protein
MSESPADELITEVPRKVVVSPPSAHASRMDRMREYFKQRPKEKIKIRASDGEQWVQINGYAFRIQAGKEVTVPVDVADMLRDIGVL